MRHEPPGTARVVALLTRAALRRLVNRFAGNLLSAFLRRKRKRAGKPRVVGFAAGATVAVVFSVLMLFQAGTTASMALRNAALFIELGDAETATPMPISTGTYAQLTTLGAQMADYGQALKPASDEAARADIESKMESGRTRAQSAIQGEAASIAAFLSGASRMRRSGGGKDVEARADGLAQRIRETWRREGMKGFRPVETAAMPFPSTSVWPKGERAREMEAAIAGVLTCLFVVLLSGHLSMGSRELAKAGWDMEWLYTFPVRARTLFAAKALEYAFVDPFGWIVSVPILFTVYWCAGMSWHSLWLAPLASASLSILAGGVQVAAEAGLRRRFSTRTIRNIQAGITAVFLPLFMILMSVAYSTILLRPFMRAAMALSPALEWLPWALPAHAAHGLGAAAGGLAVLAAAAAGAAAVLTRAAERFARDGLSGGGAAHEGRRGTRAHPAGAGVLTGVAGKDLRMMVRDRALMVRVLLMPLFVVGVQLLINPGILRAGWSDYRHAAALAWGLAVVVLLSGAMPALSIEGKALWLFYTFPVRLEEIMRRKALLWATIAALYAVAVLAAAAAMGDVGAWAALPTALAVLAGIVPLAFIAVAIGAMSVDTTALHESQRMSAWMVYLYLIISATYAGAIYAPWPAAKAGVFAAWVLIALVAWKVLRRRLPRLLDRG